MTYLDYLKTSTRKIVWGLVDGYIDDGLSLDWIGEHYNDNGELSEQIDELTIGSYSPAQFMKLFAEEGEVIHWDVDLNEFDQDTASPFEVMGHALYHVLWNEAYRELQSYIESKRVSQVVR